MHSSEKMHFSQMLQWEPLALLGATDMGHTPSAAQPHDKGLFQGLFAFTI